MRRTTTGRFQSASQRRSELMAVPAEATPAKPRAENAVTLQTIVELVRSIMHADVTSLVQFSLTEDTITWKVASGLRAHVIDEEHSLIQPITNEIARRLVAANATSVVEGIGVRDEFPARDFVVHAAEGVCDLAFTPLKARGKILGALIAGYRSPHHFTDEDKQLLEDLAAMAGLALDNARLLEKVSAAERSWERTFDAIGEGILVHDYQMQIVRCNVRAAEMMEMRPADVIGLSFSEVFARLFGKRAAAYYLAEDRGASSVFEVETESGRRYLVSIFPLPLRDGDSVSVVTWTDVTRFVEMQEQLS